MSNHHPVISPTEYAARESIEVKGDFKPLKISLITVGAGLEVERRYGFEEPGRDFM